MSGLERDPACHPERSEGSLRPARQILRCAQDDMCRAQDDMYCAQDDMYCAQDDMYCAQDDMCRAQDDMPIISKIELAMLTPIWYTETAGLSLRRKEHRNKRKKAVPPPMKEQSLDNLWLAQMLFDLGAVQFGNFTVSESAVSSPVFVNPKVLISNPTALRVASKLMQQEISLAQSLRRPRVHPFGVVAGVPVGGLLLASAYSLETNIPLIYARSRPEGTGKRGIEGHFTTGDTALIIDDLITRGSSVLETAALLEENGLKVKDVIVLIDREHGAAERLRHHGYNLISILKLDIMLNHYMSRGLISEETYRTCAEYLRGKQIENQSA